MNCLLQMLSMFLRLYLNSIGHLKFPGQAAEHCCGNVQISEQMWSLWPQLIQCFHEWAVDYFENLLVPLDNFISRGTEHFLAGTNPNYLQQARLHPGLCFPARFPSRQGLPCGCSLPDCQT